LIDDYSDVLKVRSQHLKFKKADTDGSWWFVAYEQTYSDIPVYSSEIGFTIDPQGTIVTLGARAYPKIDISTSASISSSQAIENSKRQFQIDNVVVKDSP
jgi:Zn-dependent metalloprotease